MLITICNQYGVETTLDSEGFDNGLEFIRSFASSISEVISYRRLGHNKHEGLFYVDSDVIEGHSFYIRFSDDFYELLQSEGIL